MTGGNSCEGCISGDVSEWLEVLPEYQRQSIATLLIDYDPVQVATIWLANSGPRDTAPFGGVRTAANNFYDKILQELQKALCGSSDYEAEREEISAATKGGGKLLLVSTLSTAIAPHVGAAAAVIAPAVTLTLAIVVKAGNATACDALAELIEVRSATESGEQDSSQLPGPELG